MHRTISLRAFLLAMTLFAAALAGSIALLKYEWGSGLFFVRTLTLVSCLGLILAAAYPAPRLRRAALAALAAIAVQSYFGDSATPSYGGAGPTTWVLDSLYVQFLRPSSPASSISPYASLHQLSSTRYSSTSNPPTVLPQSGQANWAAIYGSRDLRYETYISIGRPLAALWAGALVGGLTLLFPLRVADDDDASSLSNSG